MNGDTELSRRELTLIVTALGRYFGELPPGYPVSREVRELYVKTERLREVAPQHGYALAGD